MLLDTIQNNFINHLPRFCQEKTSNFWVGQNFLLRRKLELDFVVVIWNFSTFDCVVFCHGWFILWWIVGSCPWLLSITFSQSSHIFTKVITVLINIDQD